MSLLDALLEDELFLPAPIVGDGITGVTHREVWICIRSDGGSAVKFGSGAQDSPFDGSTAVKFDQVMTDIPPHSTIRLGPGIFETKGGIGNGHNFTGWIPKAGWRICGSGMFVTTLKLVNVPTIEPGNSVPIVGGTVDDLEISDLTLDCNMGGQPNTSGYGYCRMMVNGIDVNGKNIAVRRVRVINAGTQTPIYEYGVTAKSLECFPIFLGGGASRLVEDCIVEQCWRSNARETTCINCGAGTIRNCLVNGQTDGRSNAWMGLSSIKVTFLSSTPTTQTYTVKLVFFSAHYKTTDSRIVIKVMKDGTTDNPLSGYFQVTNVPSSTELEYHVTISSDSDLDDSNIDLFGTVMGFTLQATSVDGAGFGVAEGNRVIGCIYAGPYHDTYPTVAVRVVNNYYRDVYYGVASATGALGYEWAGLLPMTGTIGPSTYPGTNVKFSISGETTLADWNLVNGNVVEISGGTQPAYHGKWVVLRINDTEFGWMNPTTPTPGSDPYTMIH